MESLIVFQQVIKTYTNGPEPLTVLDQIDLSIPEGHVVVITGESGSGKSTLLHLLGGMDKPTSGSIVVGGLEISSASESGLTHYRQRDLGFIFQFHHLLKDFTALENILMPALLAGFPRSQAEPRALVLLERVGIAGRAHAFPTELSGGERQRAAVARAVMNNPRVLLADEPTGSLDEKHSREVEELLFSLSRDLGKTLVLVTHNRSLAAYSDTHFHLTLGHIEAKTQ
ncbi:MAG: ABC transporter ATP-binding protein [Spirochaetales bacterium]|nr:ABC transporter ATP-binding protein [Spirochaetales bacterium]